MVRSLLYRMCVCPFRKHRQRTVIISNAIFLRDLNCCYCGAKLRGYPSGLE